MRVCPKCKYVDPPQWRHFRFSYWIDFCTFEEFSVLEPKLAERLKNGERLVEDDDYVYRLSGKKGMVRIVHRKAKVDYGPQFVIPMEHYKQKGNASDLRKCWTRDELQKKLLEVTEKNAVRLPESQTQTRRFPFSLKDKPASFLFDSKGCVGLDKPAPQQ